MSEKRIRLLETASEMIGIAPEEQIKRMCVTVSGDEVVLVRRFERICGYTDRSAEFLRGSLLCEISGEGLVLTGVTKDCVRITGRIDKVGYTEVGR